MSLNLSTKQVATVPTTYVWPNVLLPNGLYYVWNDDNSVYELFSQSGDIITQTAHGFEVGSPIHLDGTYQLARSDDANTTSVYIVGQVLNANEFILATPLKLYDINLTNLLETGVTANTVGQTLYVSDIEAGKYTDVDPNNAVSDHYSNPIIEITGTDEIRYIPLRPYQEKEVADNCIPDLTSFAYSGNTQALNGSIITPWIDISIDGMQMIASWILSSQISEYLFTTPWDISTMSLSANSFSLSGIVFSPWDINYNSQNSIIYVGEDSGWIEQINLSNVWDITSGSDANNNFSTTPHVNGSPYFTLSDDDSIFVLSGFNNLWTLKSFTLSTPSDLNSGTLTNTVDVFSIIGISWGNISKIQFAQNGGKMFILERWNETFYELDMSTPYDISTLSYSGIFAAGSGQMASWDTWILLSSGNKWIIVSDNSEAFEYTTTPICI